MDVTKLVRVDDEVHAELKRLGKYGDSLSEIIARCIKAYKKENRI